MKRSWIGFALLLALLLGSILSSRAMISVHGPLEQKLQQAAGYALEGNWGRAEALLQKAKQDWTDREHFRSCFADHDPLEEIDEAFEVLAIFCGKQDPTAFAAGCLQLAQKIHAVGDAHRLSWQNLL